jgi:hypothetical protein
VLPGGLGTSLIQITSLQESAYAEAGLGTRLPSYTRTGTLQYYDPTTLSYKSLNLASLTTDTVVNTGTINATYYQGGHRADIAVTASFRVGAGTALTPTTSAPDATCKASACTATASAASVLTANITYSIQLDGVPATAFNMTVDLGSILAKCAYKAAFDA